MGAELATLIGSPDGILDLSEIPIALIGSWVKDGHRFSITKEDLDDIVKNFEGRGNGQVVVDYEHASENPAVARGNAVPASGWINGVSIRAGDNGKDMLYADIEWTDDAKKLIEEKKYRYFSPAIDWGAANKKTGKSKGATLTSGALTNHPFLEELPAIQLSETSGKVIDHVVVPVVKGAKIKVKVDDKHDKDDKTQMADFSFDQTRMAVSQAIQDKFGNKLAYPDMCCGKGGPWVRDIFDDYAILESDGKLYRVDYTLSSDGEATIGDDPKPVTQEYVVASEMSALHGAETPGLPMGDDPNVKEGVHRKDYAFVGDPKDKSTWKYKLDKPGRVRNALARWGQHKGIPKEQEPAALRKILKRAKGHGIQVDKSNPKYKIAARAAASFGLQLRDGFFSEEPMPDPKNKKKDKKVEMTDARFHELALNFVTAAEEAESGRHVELLTEIKSALTTREGAREMKESDLAKNMLVLLDDMDQMGVEGDRGDQDDLRSEAESRAKKIDDASDGDDTEELRELRARVAELSAKKAKPGDAGAGGGDDDAENATAVPRLQIRKIGAADKIGKMGHHAVTKGGKVMGYITSGDFGAHVRACGQGGVKASEEDLQEVIQEATGQKFTLSEITQFVDRGIEAGNYAKREEAFKVLFVEGVEKDGTLSQKKVRRLLAENRISMPDYADFADAVEDVDKAIKDGKFLPSQRVPLIKLYLNDASDKHEVFNELVLRQPRTDRTKVIGIEGTGEEITPDVELNAKIKQLTDANPKVKWATAYTQVLSENPELAQRYNKAHRQQIS